MKKILITGSNGQLGRELTRKLRKTLYKMEGKLTKKEKEDLRKKIKNKFFASNAAFKDYIGGIKK